MITISKHQGTETTCFSPTCMDIMDFCLSHPRLFFTPTTSQSLEKPLSTIKDCMNLLKRRSHLSKVSNEGSSYHITKQNMELWMTDFKKRNQYLIEAKQ